ncbi:Rib/alpha-like domain-containing protein, partial [Corynebacterium pseudodiphtheriticum]|uniref:Rib/alpha-like domain-containing protein n=1 Tax=Corynebacterium pseudodiphtheriticum TaxID=37637 RepID=UPI00234CB4DD
MNHHIPMNKAVRRKGVTIAAAALSVALVAPFAQSVAYPEISAAAQAQETNSGQKSNLELAPKELTKQPPVFYANEEAKGHLQENGPQYIRTTGILAGTFFPEGTTFELRDPNWSFEEGASGRGDKPKQEQYKPGNSVGWFGVDRKANPTELDLGPNNLAKTKASDSYNNIPYVVRETGQVLFAFGPNISNKVGSRLYVPMRAAYNDPEKKVKYVWDFEQGIQVGDAKTFNRNQPPQGLKNPVAVSVTPVDKLLQFGDVKTGYHLIQERYEEFKRENPNASDKDFKDGRLSRVMNLATAQFRGLYGQKLGETGKWGSWVDNWRALQTDGTGVLEADSTGEWYEEGEVPKNNLDLAHDDADIYRPTPVTDPVETTVGTVPDAPLGIANKEELPEDTKYDWEDRSVFDSPSEGKNAKLKVTYPDGTSEVVDVPVKVDAPSTPVPEAKDLGYTKGLGIAAEKEERRDSTGTPNLPDGIEPKEGDFFRFGEDLPTGFVKHPDPDKPNSIIKNGPVGEATPNDPSDDVVVTIDPGTGEITVEAGDKGDTNGPKDIPVEYIGANDTVKGKDSVSVDVKPRQDSDAGTQMPAQGLQYPEDGIVIGKNDSGDQRTKESGEPETSGSVTKENDDEFRFNKVLPPGFERVNDEETRVKFDGGTPGDEKDDIDLTINPNTGKVTVVGGENAKAEADIPVELVDKDGVPKDSGVISINVTPKELQEQPPAADDEDKGLNYLHNLHVAPDNYKRSDSTGEPNLPESLKEDGATFRFGPNLPEGFVEQEPSWSGVKEIVREGNSPSERIVLRINKSNGKVEVQAGDASDYPLSDLSIEYVDANGEVKATDKVTMLIRPLSQADRLLSQADRLEPKAKDGVTTSEGEKPAAGALIANKGDLPAETEYVWVKEPDVSVPGKTKGTVKVNYPDGSSETVDVELEVTEVP